MDTAEFYEKILGILEEKEAEAIDSALEDFRHERISALKDNKTLKAPFEEGPKLVIHLVPFASFRESREIDFSHYAGKHDAITPLRRTFGGQTFNFEGLLSYAPSTDRTCFRYVQVFRNGIIECVDAHEFNMEKKVVYTATIEPDILDGVSRYLAFQKEIGAALPIVFYLGLLGVAGYRMPMENSEFLFDGIPANEREDLLFPAVTARDYVVSAADLKPTFDRLWNSFGYARSFSYDAEGTWKRRGV